MSERRKVAWNQRQSGNGTDLGGGGRVGAADVKSHSWCWLSLGRREDRCRLVCDDCLGAVENQYMTVQRWDVQGVPDHGNLKGAECFFCF